MGHFLLPFTFTVEFCGAWRFFGYFLELKSFFFLISPDLLQTMWLTSTQMQDATIKQTLFQQLIQLYLVIFIFRNF